MAARMSVGVATPSIASAREHYARLFGAAAVGEPFDLPEQGVKACFVDAPNTQIELIEPLNDTSPIAAFLSRNPAGGQHHLCYEVAELDAAIADLEAAGARAAKGPVDAPNIKLSRQMFGLVVVMAWKSPGKLDLKQVGKSMSCGRQIDVL